MKEIPLTQGQVALVDDEDYYWLQEYTWYLHSGGYACTSGGKRLMHVLILKHYRLHIKELDTDHKDNNKLNNQKINLRQISHAANTYRNRKGKGVKFQHNGWVAYIGAKYLGRFKTEEEALCARREAELKYFGEVEDAGYGNKG